VSALAVYLEREGIATVIISLIRLHSDKIEPPRTLWVPFELGRPFGAPGDVPFQTRVLSSALQLLVHAGPAPVVEDFPEDDPNLTTDSTWKEPETENVESIDEELALLDSHWHKARQRYGATAVGLAGLPLRDAVRFLEKLDTDSPMSLPDYAKNDGVSDMLRIRLCADDIRAFYSEAACCEGDPSSDQVWTWFWAKTRAGDLLRRVREDSEQSDDEKRKLVGTKFLIPRAFL